MNIPAVAVYFDGEEQNFYWLQCERSDAITMHLSYNKQVGADHVLKINIKTGKRALAIFTFGEKTIRLIDHNPTFDGFFDESTGRTKQFRLGDFDAVKQLVKHDPEQLKRLQLQIPEFKVVIKEWVDETAPRWARDDMVQTDGGHDETDGCKVVGYETNVLNKDKYIRAKGREGPVIARIYIKFMLKGVVNVV